MGRKMFEMLGYLPAWTPDPAKVAVLTLAAGSGVAVDVTGWIGYKFGFPDGTEVRRHLLTQVTNFRGAYSAASVAYAVDDTAVGNSGRLYRCKVAHTSAAGTTPESGGTWAAVWDAAYPYFQTDKELIGVDPVVKQIILVNFGAASVVGTREGM